MKHPFRSLGPAIIVAAVVLGPGSILTASKTGAQYGYSMTWLLALVVILLIGTASLSARLGAVMAGTPGDELASRLGRPAAIFVGLVVFLIAGGFQTSNNLAVIKAIAPYIDAETHPALSKWLPVAVVVALNVLLLFIVYRSRSLYSPVEKAMKLMVGMMVLAFFANFVVTKPSFVEAAKGLVPKIPEGEFLVVMGLVATTFSIAGAFYQAYLVRDKGWGLADVRRTFADSLTGMLVLGGVTMLIMWTAAATLFGKDIELKTVTDVAAQLEGLFGPWAGIVFTVGIFAGALSSFLVNAMIGGRLLADGFGDGETSESRWSRHGTSLALVAGLAGGLIAHFAAAAGDRASIDPIFVAQASTILGGPALALTLLYLATRKDISGEAKKRIPEWMIGITALGFLTTLVLAWRTWGKLFG